MMMIQSRRCRSVLTAVCLHLFSTQDFLAAGFTAMPASSSHHQPLHVQQHQQPLRHGTSLHVGTISSSESFFDDFNPSRRQSGQQGGSSGIGGDEPVSSSSSSAGGGPSSHFGVQEEEASFGAGSSRHKFVTGDELHRMRHQVMAMRLELQEARRDLSQHRRVVELERAIMRTQQVDAEFVYTVSLERQELALQEGKLLLAEGFYQRAVEAREALPQFQLEGLWVGKYGEHGYEMINVTYHGDVLMAHKVTGTKNVPRGQATFQVDLSPCRTATSASASSGADEVLSPIELGDAAAHQWGCKYLQRFAGQGQVAADNYVDSQWIDGQLILVNEYFSFAWLPIGHQVFFGRPTPELILKLMKEEGRKGSGDCNDRAFLEKCWEETEHVQDDMEVSNGLVREEDDNAVGGGAGFYHQEGCFE